MRTWIAEGAESFWCEVERCLGGVLAERVDGVVEVGEGSSRRRRL
jgi:hypothetical protein